MQYIKNIKIIEFKWINNVTLLKIPLNLEKKKSFQTIPKIS